MHLIRGEYEESALSFIGFLPLFKLLKYALKIILFEDLFLRAFECDL